MTLAALQYFVNGFVVEYAVPACMAGLTASQLLRREQAGGQWEQAGGQTAGYNQGGALEKALLIKQKRYMNMLTLFIKASAEHQPGYSTACIHGRGSDFLTFQTHDFRARTCQPLYMPAIGDYLL